MSDSYSDVIDTSRYTERTKSIFEIVGTYLVDIYYNHLYENAMKFMQEGQTKNITDGYRHALFGFNAAFDKKSKYYKIENFSDLLNGINAMFSKWTSFGTLTTYECITKIADEFIPTEYVKTAKRDQKISIVQNVLVGTIYNMTKFMGKDFIVNIIDQHDIPETITLMKEKIFEILANQREIWYHKFVDINSGSTSTDDKVDKSVAERMRQELQKMVDERMKYGKVIDELYKQLEASQTQIIEKDGIIKKLIAKYRKLEQEYNVLKKELNITQDKVEAMTVEYEEKAAKVESVPSEQQMEEVLLAHTKTIPKDDASKRKKVVKQPIKSVDEHMKKIEKSETEEEDTSEEVITMPTEIPKEQVKEQVKEIPKEQVKEVKEPVQVVKGMGSPPANLNDLF